MLKIKTCRAQVKAAGTQDGTEDGEFEAIVATYDLDSWGDKIEPGAFADTLADWAAKGDPIPVLWSHNSYDPDCHIGVVTEAEEREGVGLWVKAKLDLDQPKAAQVYRLLKGRRVTQFSFAYDVKEGGWVDETVDGQDVSYYALRKLDLFEVGPCLVGVNRETELLDVKTAAPSPFTFSLAGMSPDAVTAAVKAAASTITTNTFRHPDATASRAAEGKRDKGSDPVAPSTAKSLPDLREAVERANGVLTGRKAGRVLSAANESAIREAVDTLSAVLAAVEEAADADEDTDDEKAKPSPAQAPASTKDAKAGPADGPAAPVRHLPGFERLTAELAAVELIPTN